MISQDEAIALLLGTTCTACGATLAAPGTPCAACGAIPATTAPELAEQLDGAVALAAIESRKLRTEAWEMLDAALARHEEADRAVFLARLQVRRDEAQRALDDHLKAQKSLYGPRAAARKAEQKAAGELATAAAEHDEIARADEIARRMRHGVRAETEAAIRLERATAVLRRYQDALSEATVRRRAAEEAVDHSAAKAAQLEQARDQAVVAYTNPGRVPLGPETITAGLVRLLLSGKLDDVEKLIAGQAGRMVCALTGVTDDIIAEARRELLEEQEKEGKEKAIFLRQLGDGNAMAVPNPTSSQTPQPYHAPGANATPNPYPPALIPGFGS